MPAPSKKSSQKSSPESARSPKASGAPSKQDRQRDRERRKAREKLGRQIARLEEEIHAAERGLEAVGWKLGAPDLYKDVDLLRELPDERSRMEPEIAERYADWERLSDEIAALDDAPGTRAD